MSTPYPPTYRAEQARQIFAVLSEGSSCSVIGVSGTAKSNLCRFLLEPGTRKNYLGKEWARFLFLTLDSHPLFELAPATFFDALAEALNTEARARGLETLLQTLDMLRIERAGSIEQNAALGYFFRAAHAVLAESGHRLVVLFDQFDNVYQTLPPRVFANLVALRDEFKYRVSYVTLTSEELPTLCNASECQDFYDLFKDNVIGLGPYNHADSWFELEKLAALRKTQVGHFAGEQLIRLSGGHPGLLKALYLSHLKTGELESEDDWQGVRQLLLQKGVEGECQSLSNRLRPDERSALTLIAQGGGLPDDAALVARLRLKALINEDDQIFSPLFAYSIVSMPATRTTRVELEVGPIRIDRSQQVYVYGRLKSVSPMERALLKLLMENPNETCTRDQIDEHLRKVTNRTEPMSNEAIDQQIKRLRGKVELDPSRPKLILTVQKGGYRLDV